MTKLAIIGWYGHGNFGNIMIGLGIRNSFNQHKSVDCDFYAIKKNKPVTLDATCKGEIDLKSKNDREKLKAYDGVIFGGGLFTSLFGEYWDNLDVLATHLNDIGTPLALHCVGSGDGSQIKRKFDQPTLHSVREKIIPSFDYVSVRDEHTRNLFSLSGESVFPDPAFYLRLPKQETDSKKVVVIPTTRSYLVDIESPLLRLNEAIRNAGHVPEYLPFQTQDNQDYNDLKLSKSVCNKDGTKIVVPNYGNPFDTLIRIASADKVISFRLHGAIAGLICSRPTSCVAYDPKTNPVFEAAGIPQTQIGIQTFNGSEPNLLDDVYGMPEEHHHQLRQRIFENARRCLEALV